jgi:hypothetical protein
MQKNGTVAAVSSQPADFADTALDKLISYGLPSS